MEDLRQKLEASNNALESEERLLRQTREDLENEKSKISKLDGTIQQRDASIKTGNIPYIVMRFQCLILTNNWVKFGVKLRIQISIFGVKFQELFFTDKFSDQISIFWGSNLTNYFLRINFGIKFQFFVGSNFRNYFLRINFL